MIKILSDVTKYEFDFLLKQLSSSDSNVINNFLKRINAYIKNYKMVFKDDDLFWTLPYSFDKMNDVSPKLYKYFRENSSIIILKGDLNYRKLVGDLDWPIFTELKKAIREFEPTNICAIRTIKADLIAGLDKNNSNLKKLLSKYNQDKSWMYSGEYGIIQFCTKNN